MIAVRIAAIDEHMVPTETPHVGQPHGLVVAYKIRDCLERLTIVTSISMKTRRLDKIGGIAAGNHQSA